MLLLYQFHLKFLTSSRNVIPKSHLLVFNMVGGFDLDSNLHLSNHTLITWTSWNMPVVSVRLMYLIFFHWDFPCTSVFLSFCFLHLTYLFYFLVFFFLSKLISQNALLIVFDSNNNKAINNKI